MRLSRLGMGFALLVWPVMMSAQTGSVREYAQIEETIAPTALEVVSAWIAQRVTLR